jgi:hypothetical protein
MCLRLLLGSLLVCLVAGTTAIQAAEVVTIDGVPHIRNDATPRDGVRTLRLEEQWRVGSEDDDVIFGLVTKVSSDVDGNVYVLDAQLSQVHIYSPDGQHLRSVFREGEGPGEIRDARDMIVMDDGRIGAVIEFPGKVVFVDRLGNPAGVLECGGGAHNEGGFWSLMAAFCGGGKLAITGTISQQSDTPGVNDRTGFLSLFADDGRELARLNVHHCQYNFNDFVYDEGVHLPGFWWNTAVGPDGRVYAAPQLDASAIHVWRPDGTLERVIEREYQRWKRTAEEHVRVEGMIESAMSSLPFESRVKVEEYEADIVYILRGLRARTDGSLWVLPSRGIREQPPGVLATFDVFDREGVFVEQVSIACEGNSMLDGIFFVGRDRLVVVRGFADAVAAQFGRGSRFSGEGEDEGALMEVVCYRILD